MVWPTALYEASVAFLVMPRCGVPAPGTSLVAHCCAAGPAPSSTHAVLAKWPASRSGWVIVCVAVQLMVAVGARFATGIGGLQVSPVTLGSVTVTLWSVTLPSLVAMIV